MSKTITATYLYSEFVENKSDVRKMDIVENAVKSLAFADFSSTLKGMVELAKDKGEATHKSAKNAASVLRAVFGAWRFAEDRWLRAYVPGETGYQVAYKLAVQTLKEAGIKSDGSPRLTDEQKEVKKATALGNKAYKQAAEETARGQGESLVQWQSRVMDKVPEKLEALTNEVNEERVAKLAEAVKAMCGSLTAQVIMYIVDEAEKAQSEQVTGTDD